LDWVKSEFDGDVYILAMSMGCFVTTLLSPDNVKKVVLLSIPNTNTDYIASVVSNMITKRGGKLDKEGISLIPRSSGETQKIGPSFWKVLGEFDPVKSVIEFSKKAKLLIIHPTEDEIVGDEYLEGYKEIPGVEYIEVSGDHSFKNKVDREKMIKAVVEYFKG